jgi:predicted ATP-dependent endonuclease of OLD family
MEKYIEMLRKKVVKIREHNVINELIEIITKRLLEKLEDDRDLHKVYSLELSFTNYNKKDIRAACEIVEKKIPGIFLLHISGSSEYGTYSCVNYKFTPFTFFERWLGC